MPKPPTAADDLSIPYEDLPSAGEKRKRTLLLRKAEHSGQREGVYCRPFLVKQPNMSTEGKNTGSKRKAAEPVDSASTSPPVAKKAKSSAYRRAT